MITKPGDTAPSQKPRKNLAVPSPAKFFVAPMHISQTPQKKLQRRRVPLAFRTHDSKGNNELFVRYLKGDALSSKEMKYS